jgi:hypothetical protein
VVAIAAAQNGDSLIATRTLSGTRLRLNTLHNTEIAARTVAGDRLRVNTINRVEVADLVWHPLTLINSWTNYNVTLRPPAWALDVQGIVHFRGAIQGGSESHFATLPVSIRPKVEVYLSTTLNNAAVGRIDIDTDGAAYADYLVSFASAQLFTSLDGVTYAVN